MFLWILVSGVAFLLGVLATSLIFHNRTSARQQLRGLQRLVEEKHGEIELLYQTIRKQSITEEALRERIEFFEDVLACTGCEQPRSKTQLRISTKS